MFINQNEWKKIFQKDIKDKLTESYNEYEQYKLTGNIVYLQQAGNKLFSVVENWLMVKYNCRVSSYQELKKLNLRKEDRYLLSRVNHLHVFYYANVIYADPDDIENNYEEIYDIMNKRINKKNKKFT